MAYISALHMQLLCPRAMYAMASLLSIISVTILPCYNVLEIVVCSDIFMN